MNNNEIRCLNLRISKLESALNLVIENSFQTPPGKTETSYYQSPGTRSTNLYSGDLYQIKDRVGILESAVKCKEFKEEDSFGVSNPD